MAQLNLSVEKLKLPTPIAVLGLGVSGYAVAGLFQSAGIDFAAWDDSPATRNKAEKEGFPLFDFANDGLSGFKTLIPAPGIPPSNDLIVRARKNGLTIACDIDILYDAVQPTPMIGITGTNGKSTTTALLDHIFNACGIDSAAGGNIGVAATALRPVEKDNGVYVIELSSYQIHNIDHAAFDIAVLLNISPDHIDWHGSLENYISAKKKLFSHSPNSKKQTVILGIDDETTLAIYKESRDNPNIECIPVSYNEATYGGVYIHNGMLIDAMGKKTEIITRMDVFPRLRGNHNYQNIMAAFAAARSAGLTPSEIVEAIASFKGLTHRQELVSTIGDIRFINDSKATNFDATEKALLAYDRLHLILGGKPKEGGITGIEAYANKIEHAYLIGQASEEFAHTLVEAGISFTLCQTMDNAVITAYKTAREVARNGNEVIVMLSPACASFDQYANFEQRGDHFKQLVKSLEVLA